MLKDSDGANQRKDTVSGRPDESTDAADAVTPLFRAAPDSLATAQVAADDTAPQISTPKSDSLATISSDSRSEEETERADKSTETVCTEQSVRADEIPGGAETGPPPRFGDANASRLSLWESEYLAEHLNAVRTAYSIQEYSETAGTWDTRYAGASPTSFCTHVRVLGIFRGQREFVFDRLQIFGMSHPAWLYAGMQLFVQLMAIIPILLFIVLFRAILVDHVGLENEFSVLLGLCSVMVGLFLFMDGLNFSFMPLGEAIGQHMRHLPIARVLSFAFLLGGLVTWSEPAINSLQLLGNTVDVKQSPLLHYLLQSWADFLLLCIAGGVGLASVLGILRIRHRWSLKPMIYLLLAVALGLSALVLLTIDELVDVVALAWDSGAVTTGPVTVPIMIAFGIGAGGTAHQATVEGFGIVTLASLFPVIMVLLQGLLLHALLSESDIASYVEQQSAAAGSTNAVENATPLREALLSSRSVLPLAVALLVTLKVLLKRPLPRTFATLTRHRIFGERPTFKYSIEIMPISLRENEQSSDLELHTPDSYDSATLKNLATGDFFALEDPMHPESSVTGNVGVPYGADGDSSSNADGPSVRSSTADLSSGEDSDGADTGVPHRTSPVAQLDSAKVPETLHTDADHLSESWFDEKNVSGDERATDTSLLPSVTKRAWLSVSMGTAACLVGSFLFNIGLTRGLSALGEQVGAALPSLFLQLESVDGSPLYPKGGGISLLFIFAWVLGFVVTFAEPGLQVMGRKIEVITKGEFRSVQLVAAVATGVACGMAIGIVRLALDLPLAYFLFSLYFLAFVLTLLSNEEIVNVAWDSAGVTTGPITVPFVLSLGVYLTRATSGRGGFGILALSSVCPILSVLIFGLGIRLRRYLRS